MADGCAPRTGPERLRKFASRVVVGGPCVEAFGMNIGDAHLRWLHGPGLQEAASGAKSDRWHLPCCWLPFHKLKSVGLTPFGGWKTDQVLHINVADPDHLKLMGDRFHRMISQGFTVFYLDSFGSRLEDVRAMAYFRRRMGPDIQTFVEHPCDMVLPCSGAYLELQFDEKIGRA